MKLIDSNNGALVSCSKCGTTTRAVDLLRKSKGWESHVTKGSTKTAMDSIGCRPKMICSNCGANLWEQ